MNPVPSDPNDPCTPIRGKLPRPKEQVPGAELRKAPRATKTRGVVESLVNAYNAVEDPMDDMMGRYDLRPRGRADRRGAREPNTAYPQMLPPPNILIPAFEHL